MQQSLNGFVINLAAMAVLCALFECLVPQGNLKKTIYFCIGILFVLNVAAPIVMLVKETPALLETSQQAPLQSGIDQPQASSYEDLLRGYMEESIAIENQGG